MPFEFAFLDWLQQFHNPVLDALAVFLNYAGETVDLDRVHALLLLFRRTARPGAPWPRRWYCIWWPGTHPQAAVRPAPPLRREHSDHHSGQASPRALLPLRAHGLGFCGSLCALAAKPEVGRPRAGAGGFHRLYPAVSVCALPHRCAGRPCAGPCTGFLRLVAR